MPLVVETTMIHDKKTDAEERFQNELQSPLKWTQDELYVCCTLLKNCAEHQRSRSRDESLLSASALCSVVVAPFLTNFKFFFCGGNC